MANVNIMDPNDGEEPTKVAATPVATPGHPIINMNALPAPGPVAPGTIATSSAGWESGTPRATVTPTTITAPPPVTAPSMSLSKAPSAGTFNFTAPTMEKIDDPRAAIINQAAQAQFRTQQQNLIGQLALQASGRGPSVAAAQLQQASQANQAATFAQLASARGAAAGNPGLARNAMNTSSNIQAQTSRDAAVARMQEQMNAQGRLGDTLSQARGADINLATSQAGLDQAATLAGYQGRLGQANNVYNTTYQGGMTKANTEYQGQLTMAQQYYDLQAKYAAMGLDAQKANQMAAIEIQRINQSKTLAELQNASAVNQQQMAIQAAQDAADKLANQHAADKKAAQTAQILQATAGGAGTLAGGPGVGAAASTAAGAAAPKAKDVNADSNSTRPPAQSGVTYDSEGNPIYSSTGGGPTYA